MFRVKYVLPGGSSRELFLFTAVVAFHTWRYWGSTVTLAVTSYLVTSTTAMDSLSDTRATAAAEVSNMRQQFEVFSLFPSVVCTYAPENITNSAVERRFS